MICLVPEMTYVPENIFISLREKLLQEEAFIETYKRIEDAFYTEAHRQHKEQSDRFNKNMKSPNTIVKALTLDEYKSVFYPHTRTQAYIIFNLIEKHFIHPEIQEKATLCRHQLDGTWLEDVNKLIVLALETYREDPSVFRPYQKESLPPVTITEPSIFHSKPVADISTDLVTRTAVEFCLHPYKHEKEGDDIIHVHVTKENRIELYINHPEAFDSPYSPYADLAREKLLEQLNPRTAQILMYLSHVTQSKQRPWETDINLSLNTVAKDFELNGLTLKDTLDLVQKEIYLGASMMVHAKCTYGKGNYDVGRSPLYHILHDKYEIRNNKIKDRVLTLRPGIYTQKYINRGQKKQGNICFFGELPKNVVTSPPKLRVLTKLKTYIAINSNKSMGKKRRLKSIWRFILSEENYKKLLIDKGFRRDFKKQWDNALIQLKAEGYDIQFDGTYPVTMRPTGGDWDQEEVKPLETLPQKFLETMLEAMITITWIVNKPLRNKDIGKKKKKPEPNFSGEEVKTARKARGWSLRDLEHVASIPYPTISNIENGRKISPKNAVKLLKALPELSELT